MADKLNMEAINSLPQPLMVRLAGDSSWWEVYDIDVETGLMRINVVGLLDIKEFCEIMELQDMDGNKHDPDIFWSDYESLPAT